MKKGIIMFITGLFFFASISGVYGYDASSPYTVTMNFIVGTDTSFTVALAAAETSIDFNPSDANSKEVEPDEQNASTTTPMITITNTGNVNLDFTHELNVTKPTWVNVSFNNADSIDWSKLLDNTSTSIETSVATSGTADVYFWANFTSAVQGTTQRLYQINSTAS